MARKRAFIAASGVLAGLLAMGAVTAATAASAAAGAPHTAAGAARPAAPRWRVVESVKTDSSADFTAIAATGKTTAWAFDGTGDPSPPVAYRLSGGKWRKAPFPGKLGEEVIAAGATSPTDVWAFTLGLGELVPSSRVLRWNGVRWSVVRTFTDDIANAVVLAPNDVWVFGEPGSPADPSLGVWHYHGSTWTQVSDYIGGGSGLSATDVWGFSGGDVEHWTGAEWVATSVQGLLPPAQTEPVVTGILALSATDVYAIADGSAGDTGGPVVVLHYNGRAWARVAEGVIGQYGFGPYPQFSTDGTGGLWLSTVIPPAFTSYLLHYSAGKLTPAALPPGLSPDNLAITSVVRIPGTTDQLAGGFRHGADWSNPVGVVLEYS